MFLQFAFAQNLSHKNIGIFLSPKGFTYQKECALPITQFLSVGENRSQVENIKNECITRLGERLTTELQQETTADSVYFVNADASKNKFFIDNYNADSHSFNVLANSFAGTDYFLIIEKMTVNFRKAPTVFINEGEMISERKKILNVAFSIAIFDVKNKQFVKSLNGSADEWKDNTYNYKVNIYAQESMLGKMFSVAFTKLAETGDFFPKKSK
jgi:CheY-specific phosphatase CheX